MFYKNYNIVVFYYISFHKYYYQLCMKEESSYVLIWIVILFYNYFQFRINLFQLFFIFTHLNNFMKPKILKYNNKWKLFHKIHGNELLFLFAIRPLFYYNFHFVYIWLFERKQFFKCKSCYIFKTYNQINIYIIYI